MAIMKRKQSEITIKNLELNESNQKMANAYFDKMKEINAHRNALETRREESKAQINRLQAEIAALNQIYVLELDPQKLAEMDSKRKDLKEQINNHTLFVEMNVTELIKKRMMEKDVRDVVANALKESDEIDREADSIIKTLEEEIDRLENLKREQMYISAGGLYESLRYS